MLNLFRFVGFKHLQLRPGRTLLTTIGIALGIALYVAINIINRSTLSSFRENVNAVAGKATLVVSSAETGFPEGKLEIVSKTPGVEHAVPMVETRTYFAGRDSAHETVVVLGVDLLREQAVRTYKTTDEQVIDDPLVFLNQPDSIIITRTFAERHKLALDSVFELATAHGKKKFTVRGMLSPEGPAKAYGGAIAIMDIDGARMTFGKEEKLDRIDIITKSGAPVDDVLKDLQGRLGAGYSVERPDTQSENMERMVNSYQAMLTFFSTLALMVGLFLITNSVSIAVAERRREIGILRALGASRVGILALFLSEALAMGVVGAFAGAWLGRGLASILVGLVTRSIEIQYRTNIAASALKLETDQIVFTLLLGGLASVIAALWPSFRATRIEPIEAMRKKEVTDASEKPSFFQINRFGFYLGLCFATIGAISSSNEWAVDSQALQKVETIALMGGAALIGPRIVTFLLRAIQPLIAARASTVLRLSQDNLLRSPARTSGNVLTLMVGLMLVTLVAAVLASFKNTTSDWAKRAFLSDVLVSSNGRLISF
ncbi:MAG: FtsX-like permease family protein, partial [Bdellovibrionota bacterium]